MKKSKIVWRNDRFMISIYTAYDIVKHTANVGIRLHRNVSDGVFSGTVATYLVPRVNVLDELFGIEIDDKIKLAISAAKELAELEALRLERADRHREQQLNEVHIICDRFPGIDANGIEILNGLENTILEDWKWGDDEF